MQGIEISIEGELVSKPYVDMTIKLMEKFSVKVTRLDGLQKLHIPGKQPYKSPGSVFVEGDASSASYFLAGATITGGTIRVVGCGSESVQVCLRPRRACCIPQPLVCVIHVASGTDKALLTSDAPSAHARVQFRRACSVRLCFSHSANTPSSIGHIIAQRQSGRFQSTGGCTCRVM